MKTILLLLILSFPFTALAQDSTSSKNNQIRFKPFKGYVQNGQRLSEKKLKAEIYKVPAAIPFYKKANNRKITGCLLFIGGAASFLFTNYKPEERVGNKIKAGTIIGFTSMVASIPILLSSFKQLKKSIAIHNETRRLTY